MKTTSDFENATVYGKGYELLSTTGLRKVKQKMIIYENGRKIEAIGICTFVELQ